MPRKRYSVAFKSKVALETIKGQKTLSEIASEYKIHPNQASQWKRQLQDGLQNIFIAHRQSNHSDAKETDKLYTEIGRLKVELDWLKKSCNDPEYC